MHTQHPKAVRRKLLLFLYERYIKDPLEMPTPEDFLADGSLSREELLANIFYLHDRRLVELMLGYNPPMFAAARIMPDGIDLVENAVEFDLRFPPAASDAEPSAASGIRLVERLVLEADYSPLDGERRKCLLRDVQYLRDEISRPAERWRAPVIFALLEWIAGHFDGAPEALLPSFRRLKEHLSAQLQSRG